MREFSAAGFRDITLLRTESEGTRPLAINSLFARSDGTFLHVMATLGDGYRFARLSVRQGLVEDRYQIFWFFAMLIHFVWNGGARCFGQLGIACISVEYSVCHSGQFLLLRSRQEISTFATAWSHTYARIGLPSGCG